MDEAGRKKARKMVHEAVLINEIIPATCFDINDEGMYIQTGNTFKSGEIISLDFKVKGRLTKLKATVRHLEAGFGIGVKFVNPPLDVKANLRSMIEPEQVPKSGQSGIKTVLLIDSKQQSRTMYKNRLNNEGYIVVESTSGTEAYSILQDMKPDLVVIDNNIDGINAYKILQFMQTKEQLKSVPAIMLTTKQVPGEAERVLSMGVRSYMVKATTTPNVLTSRIREILEV